MKIQTFVKNVLLVLSQRSMRFRGVLPIDTKKLGLYDPFHIQNLYHCRWTFWLRTTSRWNIVFSAGKGLPTTSSRITLVSRKHWQSNEVFRLDFTRNTYTTIKALNRWGNVVVNTDEAKYIQAIQELQFRVIGKIVLEIGDFFANFYGVETKFNYLLEVTRFQTHPTKYMLLPCSPWEQGTTEYG